MQNFSPLDGRAYPRFSGIKTFFRLPHAKTANLLKSADVAILGVPFDGGVSYRPGSRFAPEHIRSISALGRGQHPVHGKHVFKALKVCDAGDVQVVPQDIEKTHRRIKSNVSKLIKLGALPLMVGGDHSTTIGSLQAMVKHHGQIGIVHFDAHTDTYPPAWGCNVHHGTFMRLGHEQKWFKKNAVVQIGIRGPFSSETDLEVPKKYGYQVVTADDIHLKGFAHVEKVLSSLDTSCSYYVSFDVDCLDPSYAPGIGTPVPGGLTSFQAMHILRMLTPFNIVGGDVVEVSPAYDSSEITSLFAVTVLWELLGLVAQNGSATRS